MNLLEVKNIKKSFDDLEVLKDISMSVAESEVISILGPSGSGKSTFLRCMTMLEKIDGGSMEYCGKEAVNSDSGVPVYADRATLKEIQSYYGLVFQNFNLFPHYSVLKNIADAPIHVQKRDKDEVYAEAKELLRKMNLEDKGDYYPYQLSGDVMTFELYPDIAPNTVKNFISLIKKGFYDGLIFHRVINGFMIQGGCPDGNGTGGPGYSIRGEFAQNGFANDLKHEPGVLSMARTMMPNSAGSQFFIMHKNSPHLDGSYAAFGKIVDGLDIVNKIADVPTDYMDRPLEDQRIKTVTVDTKGVEYDEPEKM